jgi:hypothetical protein
LRRRRRRMVVLLLRYGLIWLVRRMTRVRWLGLIPVIWWLRREPLIGVIRSSSVLGLVHSSEGRRIIDLWRELVGRLLFRRNALLKLGLIPLLNINIRRVL